ncbi:alpha/beta hydrolase [Evansella clarkii]|uniref:alpha/beta hydrolase n=1 Tax=Evansella clarkii TaxID=79879 RepID=UPI000B43190C|nr:alpha/beta hydrolase [Evansella clarkii]
MNSMTQQYTWIEDMNNNTYGIDEKNPHDQDEALQQYLKYYQFNMKAVDEYRCGTVRASGKKQFIQFFLKQQPAGTVYLVHGYLDHSGGLSRTINQLLQRGYQVIVLDLPGHGFSEGNEGLLTSFDDYIAAIEQGYHLILDKLDLKSVAGLGHSTGGALLFHASAEKRVKLESLILAAPLYYPYQWKLFEGLLTLSGKVISRKKRGFKKNSEDKIYQQFLRSDPLQVRVLTAEWVTALKEWQLKIEGCPVAEQPVYVLQGTRDTTVDWKQNIRFYREKCGEFQVALFPGARHQLLNERKEITNLAHQRIHEFLRNRSVFSQARKG